MWNASISLVYHYFQCFETSQVFHSSNSRQNCGTFKKKLGKFSRPHNLNNAPKQHPKLLVGKTVFINVKIEFNLVEVLNRYREHIFAELFYPLTTNTLLIASFF